MALVSKLVDQVASGEIARLLKREGFRKYGRTFVRARGTCQQTVNVQASVSNRADEGRFTLNLGVYFHGVATRLARPAAGKTPKEYDATVRLRIGHLLPEERDYWWEICSHTDVEALSGEIAGHLRDLALPWLESLATLESTLHEVTTGRFPDPLTAAAVALELGRDEQALTILESTVASHPAFGHAARALARRNGLPIERLKAN